MRGQADPTLYIEQDGGTNEKDFQLTSLLAVALFAGAVATSAQTVTKMEAEIAFDFAVGDKTLDAGKYEVRVARNSAGGASVLS